METTSVQEILVACRSYIPHPVSEVFFEKYGQRFDRYAPSSTRSWPAAPAVISSATTWILNWSFFAAAYLEEGRAAKAYKHFVETFILWQRLFDNHGDLHSVLAMPYPFFYDIILRQVEEKKAEKKRLEEAMRKIKKK